MNQETDPDAKPFGDPDDTYTTADIEVFPADARIGTPALDAAVGASVAKTTAIECENTYNHRQLYVQLNTVGADCAFSVHVIYQDKDWKLARITAHAGETAGVRVPLPQELDQVVGALKIDVALVGEPDALWAAWKQDHYWPGRILFKNAVMLSRGDTRPFRLESGTRANPNIERAVEPRGE